MQFTDDSVDDFYRFLKALGPVRCYFVYIYVVIETTVNSPLFRAWGNLSSLDDLLLDGSNSVESAWLCALNLKYCDENVVVHLACCDRESRRIVCGEFVDSIQLANLETALVQLESRECLVPMGVLSTASDGNGKVNKADNAVVAEHLGLIFERVGVLVTEVKKCKFNNNNTWTLNKYP
ncbi:unnamed protein product [Echinostoma caproni]|uniref:MutS_II domain-containing protein n=1 Tax=Echinostoma caproni TaxID=27848 RepID=A0A183A0I0_9TREM|nr:unnamed protein product [Echinostoma caproni]